MLQVILGVIQCISNFHKLCASKTTGPRVKDMSISLSYPVLCDHCLPSCQAERQAPGLLFSFFQLVSFFQKFWIFEFFSFELFSFSLTWDSMGVTFQNATPTVLNLFRPNFFFLMFPVTIYTKFCF